MDIYETNKDLIMNLMLDVWKMFPDKTFGEMIDTVFEGDIYDMPDEEIQDVLKAFYYQNM